MPALRYWPPAVSETLREVRSQVGRAQPFAQRPRPMTGTDSSAAAQHKCTLPWSTTGGRTGAYLKLPSNRTACVTGPTTPSSISSTRSLKGTDLGFRLGPENAVWFQRRICASRVQSRCNFSTSGPLSPRLSFRCLSYQRLDIGGLLPGASYRRVTVAPAGPGVSRSPILGGIGSDRREESHPPRIESRPIDAEF